VEVAKSLSSLPLESVPAKKRATTLSFDINLLDPMIWMVESMDKPESRALIAKSTINIRQIKKTGPGVDLQNTYLEFKDLTLYKCTLLHEVE
jgi:hypothetical protein